MAFRVLSAFAPSRIPAFPSRAIRLFADSLRSTAARRGQVDSAGGDYQRETVQVR